MKNMIVTLALLLLAFAPQTGSFTGDWLLSRDQMGPACTRVSVTQEGVAVRATWDNESIYSGNGSGRYCHLVQS